MSTSPRREHLTSFIRSIGHQVHIKFADQYTGYRDVQYDFALRSPDPIILSQCQMGPTLFEDDMEVQVTGLVAVNTTDNYGVD